MTPPAPWPPSDSAHHDKTDITPLCRGPDCEGALQNRGQPAGSPATAGTASIATTTGLSTSTTPATPSARRRGAGAWLGLAGGSGLAEYPGSGTKERGGQHHQRRSRRDRDLNSAAVRARAHPR